MISRRITSTLTALVLTLICLITPASATDLELDSRLATCETRTELLTVLDSAISVSDALAVDPDILQLRESLDAVSGYIERLKAGDPKELDDLCASYGSQNMLYNETYAGTTATNFYRVGLKACNDGLPIKGVELLRTAYECKTYYLSTETARVASTIRRARRLYHDGDPEASLEMLNGCVFDPGTSAKLVQLQESKAALTDSVSSQLRNQKAISDMWQQSERPTFRWSVFLTAGMFRQASVVGYNITLKPGQFFDYLPVPEISSNMRLSFGVTAMYRLNDYWQIGGSFRQYRHKYDLEESTLLMKMDASVDCYASELYGRFIMKPAIGLRPYLQVGAGYTWYEFGEQTVGVYTLADNIYDSYEYHEYTSETYDYSASTWSLALGLEYIPSLDSKLAFMLEAFILNRLKEDLLIGDTSVGLNLGIGMLF